MCTGVQENESAWNNWAATAMSYGVPSRTASGPRVPLAEQWRLFIRTGVQPRPNQAAALGQNHLCVQNKRSFLPFQRGAELVVLYEVQRTNVSYIILERYIRHVRARVWDKYFISQEHEVVRCHLSVLLNVRQQLGESRFVCGTTWSLWSVGGLVIFKLCLSVSKA